jgi:hypothetical protein
VTDFTTMTEEEFNTHFLHFNGKRLRRDEAICVLDPGVGVYLGSVGHLLTERDRLREVIRTLVNMRDSIRETDAWDIARAALKEGV